MSTKLERVRQATECRHILLPASYRFLMGIMKGTPPDPKDISDTREALEKLIQLALYQEPKTRDEMAAFARDWDAKVEAGRAASRHGGYSQVSRSADAGNVTDS